MAYRKITNSKFNSVIVQRFGYKTASLHWFFIGYWILKTRLGFYPASLFFIMSWSDDL